MTALTTAQKVTYTARILNGVGKVAPVDGDPVAASSDDTVVAVTQPTSDGQGTWSFEARGVTAGSANITFTADADVSENVNSIVGTDSIDVTEDPRFSERHVELSAGTPSDV